MNRFVLTFARDLIVVEATSILIRIRIHCPRTLQGEPVLAACFLQLALLHVHSTFIALIDEHYLSTSCSINHLG